MTGTTQGYALTITVDLPFEAALAASKEHLATEGFGILSEIDLAATLHAKLGVDVAPQVILGACRPPLAHAALQAEPSIGLLLPCNVVVRAIDDGSTVVEAMNPDAMVRLTGNPGLEPVATEAGERLRRALSALEASGRTPA